MALKTSWTFPQSQKYVITFWPDFFYPCPFCTFVFLCHLTTIFHKSPECIHRGSIITLPTRGNLQSMANFFTAPLFEQQSLVCMLKWNHGPLVMGDTGGCTFQIRLGHGLRVLWHWINNSRYNSQFSPQLRVAVGVKINNCGTKTEKGVLDGTLIWLHQVQLCVFPLLQDPVELLCERVVERRHALGVGLPQQHVAVPVHLPQHAG